MNFRILAAVAAATLTLGGSGMATAADIDTTGGVFAFDINPFGAQNTATYGQTFVADGSSLTGFSLYLGQNTQGPVGSLDFKGYIGTWDGSKLGSVLFTSDTRNKNTDALTEYTFNTGNLAVTLGTTYVAFLSVSDLAPQADALYVMPAVQNAISGSFVYLNNGTDFGQLSTSNWESFSGNDVYFKASFNGAVPEPATWAMMIIGFGAAGSMIRRRKAVIA